jgi:hypothetical protein
MLRNAFSVVSWWTWHDLRRNTPAVLLLWLGVSGCGVGIVRHCGAGLFLFVETNGWMSGYCDGIHITWRVIVTAFHIKREGARGILCFYM